MSVGGQPRDGERSWHRVLQLRGCGNVAHVASGFPNCSARRVLAAWVGRPDVNWALTPRKSPGYGEGLDPVSKLSHIAGLGPFRPMERPDYLRVQ